MLEVDREVVVSVLITIGLVTSLLGAAQPSSATGVTVSGPDSVSNPETVTYTAAVELPSEASLDGVTITLRPVDGDDEVVSIAITPDGTVQRVRPAQDVVGAGEIRVNRLRKSLAVTRLDRDDETGYGYGYGYGGEERTVVFEFQLDVQAFKQGAYQLRVTATAGGEPIEAGELRFSVDRPGNGHGNDGGDAPGEGNGEAPGDGPEMSDRDLRTIVQRGVSFVSELGTNVLRDGLERVLRELSHVR